MTLRIIDGGRNDGSAPGLLITGASQVATLAGGLRRGRSQGEAGLLGVYPGRNRQQFSRLGLMPGDLVTAINGTPLDDPARGMEMLQSMNSASQVTVTVERNSQSSQININNAAVAAESAAAEALPEAIPVSEVPATSTDTDPAE